MLSDIKQALLADPLSLKEVLEAFGYCNITIRPKYLQCGRNQQSSRKSITIRLQNNDYLYVTDYPRNIHSDLFSYIGEQRGVSFSEILSVVRQIIGEDCFYSNNSKGTAFAGFYKNIYSSQNNVPTIYDESILNKYTKAGNVRFVRDNIPIDTQRYFNLMYDVESQSIVIPIYNEYGQLMGIKARLNCVTEHGELKYFYLVPCLMTQTLYGYSQNYNAINNNIIYVFESEKSVMQCHSYGVFNCVAMGSGSISEKQTALLMELQPKTVVFMHDVGYNIDAIMRNIDTFKSYSRFSEIPIGYWDYTKQDYKDKMSPSDMGKDTFMYIINHEIVMMNR